MKHLLVILFIIIKLFATTIGVAEETAEEAVLESISYEKDADKLEKIIFKLNGAHIPKVFKIKGERPRLVFDFLDTRYSDLINRIADTSGGLVKGVRVGIHDNPPKTRVVVDLEPEEKFKYKQDFEKQENTLSITFYPSESDAATPAEVGKKSGATHAEVKKKTHSAQAKVEKEPIAEAAPAGSGKDVAPLSGRNPFARKGIFTQIELPLVPPAPEPLGQAELEAATQQRPQPVIDVPTAPETVVEQEADDGKSLAPAAQGQGPTTGHDLDSLQAQLEESGNPIFAELTGEEPIPVDPILRDVSFESTADNSEVVMFKLNDFYPPIVFGLEKGTPRVVCDFLDTALDKAVRGTIETDGKYVSRIRVATHKGPDKIRVVLDLVPNRNYDLQQVFFKDDNLFVIIVNELKEEAPSTARNVPGSLPKS